MERRKTHTLFLVQFSILLAIEALFCFTPLGSLHAFGFIVATLGMIPVIITAVLLGPVAGTLMGTLAGLFSFLVWTFTPPNPPLAFVFTPLYSPSPGEYSGNFGSVLICFVPRILVGTVAGLVFQFSNLIWPKKNVLTLSLSAVLGSMTNTLLVMGGIFLFFRTQYSSLGGGQAIFLLLLSTIFLPSGIPEAIVSAIVTSAVCKPLRSILTRNR